MLIGSLRIFFVVVRRQLQKMLAGQVEAAGTTLPDNITQPAFVVRLSGGVVFVVVALWTRYQSIVCGSIFIGERKAVINSARFRAHLGLALTDENADRVCKNLLPVQRRQDCKKVGELDGLKLIGASNTKIKHAKN